MSSSQTHLAISCDFGVEDRFFLSSVFLPLFVLGLMPPDRVWLRGSEGVVTFGAGDENFAAAPVEDSESTFEGVLEETFDPFVGCLASVETAFLDDSGGIDTRAVVEPPEATPEEIRSELLRGEEALLARDGF